MIEKEIQGNAIDLESDDLLHDIIADQVNIANNPDTESTSDIVSIADSRPSVE